MDEVFHVKQSRLEELVSALFGLRSAIRLYQDGFRKYIPDEVMEMLDQCQISVEDLIIYFVLNGKV